MFQKYSRYFGNASNWLVVGMSGILLVVVLILAVMNYNREREYMVKILSEKGASLIRAFEAGARTGMMGGFGTLARLDTLIKETSMQKDILYISIVDSSGIILAHSHNDKVGKPFLEPKPIGDNAATKDVKWRTVTDGDSTQAFEVYKLFLTVLPEPTKSQLNHKGMNIVQNRMGVWCDSGWMTGLQEDKLLNPYQRPTIIIGMDISFFEEAIRADIRFTILISGVLFLLAMAGVVSLFWAHNYTRSKKLLSDVSAFASEMIANLPEGIILTDSSFKVHYINQVASKMLGVDIFKTIGCHSEQILPVNIHAMGTSISNGETVDEHETKIKQKNGDIIPTSVIATEVITETGTFVGIMYILKDLTQLKQLQLEIQKKDKLAVIGNLAAGVAHEVRNPLSSIKGYASYFKALFPKDSDNRKAAEVMISETDRLNRVITELLEISRPSDIKPQRTDLQSVLDTTLKLIQPDPGTNAKVQITRDVPETIGRIFIDPDRFVQVLMNIYLNSIQAMPDGGVLHTRVFTDNNRIVISITDTGAGMSDETKSQIFNPYFTTKTTGTGLGLAIVQKIVEAHNGELTVVSQEGKGTSFTISLPNI